MSVDAIKQALAALDRVMSHGAAVQEAKDILRAAIEQAPMHYYRGDEQGNMTRSDIHVEQEPVSKLDASAPLVVHPHPAFQKWQERKPVAWRKNYQNSGYTYFDERWGTIPDDAEPLFSN